MGKNLKYFVIVSTLLMVGSCKEDNVYDELDERPIEFDFCFGDSSDITRGLIDKANLVVYVSADQGQTYYPYTLGVTGRWECNSSSTLKWSDKTMKLWAIVRNDRTAMSSTSTTTEIEPNQSSEGFEDSDFLACVGTYTYSTGTVQMTLQHKVAHLVVNVSNCFNASLMACETTAELATTGLITVGSSDITLSEQTGSTTSKIQLYRTSYNTSTNTATFEAYLLPRTTLGSAFKLTCGNTSAITYTTEEMASSVKLEGGKTTTVNIALASVGGNAGTGIWEFNANGETDANGYDRQDTGSYQEFTAPCAGKYKLEVWGAQGGSYTDLTYTSSDYTKYSPTSATANPTAYELCKQYFNKKFTAYDEAKRGIKECIGGKGAYVTGVVKLSAGDKLYVYVGKAGSEKFVPRNKMQINSGNSFDVYQMPGGWNGGATAIVRTNYGGRVSTDNTTSCNRNQFSGAGGGATDIALKGDRWDSPAHLFSRIIVAGGGGGGMYYPNETGYYNGGYGGGGALLGTSTWTGAEGDGYYTARGRGGSLSRGYDVRYYYCIIEPNSYNLINSSGITQKSGNTGDYDYTSYFENAPLSPVFGKGGACYWTASAYEGVGAGGGGWYGGGGGSGWLSNGAGAGGSSYAWTNQYYYDGTPLCDFYQNISKEGFYYNKDGYQTTPSKQNTDWDNTSSAATGRVMNSKDYSTFMDYIDRQVNPEGEGGVRKTDGTLKVAGKYFLSNVANQGGVREGNGFARITLLAE